MTPSWPDTGLILAIALVPALLAGAAGLLLLRVGARRGLRWQLRVVALAPVLSLAAGCVLVAVGMFLSQHDLRVVLWLVGIAVVLALVVTGVLARRFMTSIDRLLGAARTVGSGAAVDPLIGRTEELRRVAAELAAADARLAAARAEVERLEGSRRELIAWASHDLRAPLAAVRAMAEALEDGLVPDPPRYLRGIRAQVDQMTELVDDLFELSLLHSGGLRLLRSPVSLYDLVSDQIADLAPLADARGVRIEAAGALESNVDVDARQVARALRNLLTNALRHSPPGGRVLIEVAPAGAVTTVAVHDEGGGIDPETLPRIFEAGFRGDVARGADGGASGGLGLAIVRGVAEAHGGSARVEPVPGGSRFVLDLPAAG